MYKIIALIGEAGTGKDSLMQAILGLQPDLHEIVSCTTRPKREGEAHGVNYFYYTPEKFGDMVLNDEMLECTTFNGWFYGTSYESVRSDCINIGVFNPAGVEALLARPDVDVEIIRVCAAPKTRLLRQLNREDNPCVDEIIRRYNADRMDFDDVEHDFECYSIWNGDGTNLIGLAETVLCTLSDWMRLGNFN
jgi:guanylate kinase